MPALFEFAEATIFNRPTIAPERVALPGSTKWGSGHQRPFFWFTILSRLIAPNRKAAQSDFSIPKDWAASTNPSQSFRSSSLVTRICRICLCPRTDSVHQDALASFLKHSQDAHQLLVHAPIFRQAHHDINQSGIFQVGQNETIRIQSLHQQSFDCTNSSNSSQFVHHGQHYFACLAFFRQDGAGGSRLESRMSGSSYSSSSSYASPANVIAFSQAR